MLVGDIDGLISIVLFSLVSSTVNIAAHRVHLNQFATKSFARATLVLSCR